jgi:hypothetical protein
MKLASLMAAGVLFQGVDCALSGQELGAQYAQTVAALFISDWVNDLFGVTSFSF